MPLDEEAEGDWRAITDAGGALRPELTEPRPVGPAGESSLLPAPTDAYATAAATTADGIRVCPTKGVSGGLHKWFSALGIRSPKVVANALSAGFQRMVHRVCPVPLRPSDLATG